MSRTIRIWVGPEGAGYEKEGGKLIGELKASLPSCGRRRESVRLEVET